MTSPGEGAPDGAYRVGAPGDYGRPESEIVGQWTNKIGGGFQNSQGSFAVIFSDILSQIGAVVADVITGIASGVVAVGGALVSAVTSIVDGIVNLIQNLAGAVLGGGARAAAKGLPSTFEPGGLADIADGQRALIDSVNALGDDAGFCNLTMSKNWRVTGNANTFLDAQFDSYVTAHKNARMLDPYSESGGEMGILLFAPGVWEVLAKLTVVSASTARQYFEVQTEVWRVDREYRQSGELNPGTITVYYTHSRHSDDVTNGDYQSVNLSLPVLIPEIGVVDRWPDGSVKVLTVGYSVIVKVRFRNSTDWRMVGGTMRSTLSAKRMSVDATDYSPPLEATETGVIS